MELRGCVELRVFWCETEGFFCVELRGFWSGTERGGTEGFLVSN